MNRIAQRSAALLLSAAAAAPALAAPETYTIDGTHSFSRFSYSHFALATQLSKFDETTGTITLDKDAIGANTTAVIQRSEFNAGQFAAHIGDDVTITVALAAIKN